MKIWCLFHSINDYNCTDDLIVWWKNKPTLSELGDHTGFMPLEDRKILSSRGYVFSDGEDWTLEQTLEGVAILY